MKKILALLLAVCMMFGMAACGGTSEDKAASDDKTEGGADKKSASGNDIPLLQVSDFRRRGSMWQAWNRIEDAGAGI